MGARRYEFGRVRVEVTYDRARDEYRGDLSWPEVDPSGRESPQIRHRLVQRVPAGRVLVQFTDVTKPGGEDKLRAAAHALYAESRLHEVAALR